jgi:hypothetical protein
VYPVVGNRLRVAERMGGAADPVAGPAHDAPTRGCRNPNSRVRPDGVTSDEQTTDPAVGRGDEERFVAAHPAVRGERGVRRQNAWDLRPD